VHPEHAAIQARLSEVRARRDKGQSTLPSRMAIEQETNPFLWAPDASAFASLRAAKDVFRAA
jgi:hydroxyacylglutathione hydrolase